MRGRVWERRWWLAALAAGLLLRAVFAWKHPRFDGDTLVYGDLARNMLRHHVYGLTEAVVRPTLIRLPGYPFFLVLCFAVFGTGKYMAVLWVQIALGLAGCWMLGGLARRLFGERAGLATIWLACLCPFSAEYDALALTESLAMLCIVMALVGMERWGATYRLRWAVLAGLACAYAVLLRPDRGLLAAVCAGTMLCFVRRGPQRKAGWGPAVVILLVALPLGPWTVRNWRDFHVVQPLAPKYANDPDEFVAKGFNRWYRTWGVEYLSTVNTYWMWDGERLNLSDLPERAFDSEAQRVETAQIYAQYNAEQSATPESDAAFTRLAEEREKAHPLRTFAAMPLGRVADMWLRPRTEFFNLPLAWWRWQEHPRGSAVCLLWALLNAALLAVAVAGALRWRRWWRHPAGLAAVGFVVMRSALLLTIDNSEPRYTVECFPVLVLLAGIAWSRSAEALDIPVSERCALAPSSES